MKLRFGKDGEFKILQIADTHAGAKISPDTINLITAALKREKPDLVVFSGDQIWGSYHFLGSRKKIENALFELTKPVQDSGVPFAVCFGNHDRQVGISNEEQFEIYKKFKGFIGENTPGIDGCANQVIELEDGGDIKYLIFLIDSHTNLNVGYDNVHQNQIDWYKNVRNKYKKICARYVPAVVIQHIPVPEVTELLCETSKSTKGAVQGFRNHAGKWYVLNKNLVNKNAFMGESPADPMENSGEFAAMAEMGDVRGIYFGHDHNNSFNGKVQNIDIGYTQGAGFDVYGPGLDRGVRIIKLHTNGELDTYDLRYKDIVGKKVKRKARFAFFQIMPTNLYDAAHRALKILASLIAAAAIIAVIILLINNL
ncbi:MAG: metallophosphoesterase family protein [Clostridiales bacterium]|nr:metallophosphoesterase family protein [Clostridiales bacterium]